ncbi:MAG: amino acid adenylation domain-containing protein [Thiohalocapsa sp.]
MSIDDSVVGADGSRAIRDSTPAQEAGAETLNLTHSQLMIWTGQRLAPQTPLYNMAFRFDLHGEIDVDLFRSAFQALVDGTDALRTVFAEEEGVPVQRILPRLSYQPDLVELSDEADPAGASERWILSRSQQSFDLAERCFDAALIRLGPSHFVWFLNQHHLTMDASATSLLYRNLGRLYGRLCKGETIDNVTFPTFADYVLYEQSLRGTEQYAAAVAYWEEFAARPAPHVRLYGRGASQRGYRTERVVCPLGIERARRLQALANTPGMKTLSVHMSLFNLLSTILFAYIYRVGDSSAPVIGTPAHNRSSLAFRETAGLFIELFPLRVELDPRDTFLSLMQKVSAEGQGYLRHALPGTSSTASLRLFNVVLNYIHATFEPFDGIPMTTEWVHTGFGDPEHDLRLQVHAFEGSGNIVTCFDFNQSRFDPQLRSQAVRHFLRILDAFIADPGRPIATVGLLDDQERDHFLESFNQTASVPGYASVMSLFRQHAAADASRTALCQGNREVSYGELDETSDRLARVLARQGLGDGSLAGVFVERSVEMVVGLLAVLKTGAGYVPLESHLPKARIAYILRDTNARVVLTTRALKSRLPPAGTIATLDLETDWIEVEGSDCSLADSGPNHTAYVIYTSGSTGTPKGVMIDHAGLSGYVRWAQSTFNGNQPAIFPLYSSFGFDLTVTSIFVPLVSGGSIVVYPEEEKGLDLAILRVFAESKVDIVKLTPAHLRLVEEHDLRKSRIKTLILGGEDLKSASARRIMEASGGRVALFNEYGPTEAVVGCMFHRFQPYEDIDPSVPIGAPADGVRIYVLDDGLNPVPEGVAGELYIGGDRLASGYLNRPDLTAERFLPDPSVPGRRMYRTGDLARFKPGGNLEYLGRNDRQVKIRGVRIEPSELEHVLLEHPSIDACVVDVTHHERYQVSGELRYCKKCGLSSDFPDARFDAAGVCSICNEYELYRDRAESYFGDMSELRGIFVDARSRGTGRYDCMMLLSGGKDSTYALYQIAQLTGRVLAVTLDNGFISDGAKANIGRVIDALGIEHRYLKTPAMNAIFVDSLERHSNVCHGCFKTLYTLALGLAREERIPLIVTGLSRGQFFETRLTSELFREMSVDVAGIDQTLFDARKAYHRIDDAVSRLLDVELFRDDRIFDQVEFVDFYRYCDAALDEVYSFLAEHAPWIRPGDTGRSTNCLINDVGIHVHKQKEGFHNYTLPYSWDVRLGHKERDAALDELNDQIDEERVHKILSEIGYGEEAHALVGQQLTAYFTATDRLTTSELRRFLGERLPETMVPSSFVQLEQIPLTQNGKVDRDSLPRQAMGRNQVNEVFRAPSSDVEKRLASIWRSVLGVRWVGVEDNFYDLGGDSLAAIRIASRATEQGLAMNATELFHHQTIASLALAVRNPEHGSVPTNSTEPRKALDDKTRARLAALFGTRSGE